ncbi:MAG: MFS transporter [Planctomycetes bacterium]|nr:MFS transporter [Planctomycetota bacterium]
MTTKNAWVVVGLLWVVALLNYLDRQLITTMGKPIKADLILSDSQFGLLSSIFLWVYGICSPVAGFVADRFGRKKVIVGSLVVWSLATLLTGYVRTFEEMLIARAIMGVSEAFYIPAALALIVEYHQGSTRSRATGLHLSGTYVGSIVGGLGGWIAEEEGWRFGFQLFGLLGVGYAFVIAFLLPMPKATELHHANAKPTRIREAIGGLLQSRGFVILLIMNATMGAAYWTIKSWLPTFFNTEMGVALGRSGIYGAMAFNSAAFVGMLIAGTISDHWAMRNPRARMIVPAVGFLAAAPCLFLAGFSSAVPVLIFAVVVVGMGQGGLDANLMPAVCIVANPRYRATGYGMLNFVGTTTGGLMTYIGGLLKDANVPFGRTFQFASGFILITGLLLLTIRPRAAVAQG